MGRGSGTGQRSASYKSNYPINSSDLLGFKSSNLGMNQNINGEREGGGAVGDHHLSKSPQHMIPPLYESGLVKGINGDIGMSGKGGLEKNARHGDQEDDAAEQAPLLYLITTYFSYLILIVTGHIRDFFFYRLYPSQFKHLSVQNGLAPINSGFGKLKDIQELIIL